MSGNDDRTGWGLRLGVFRRAADRPIETGDTTRGGISSRYSTLVLVGIVDYRHVTKRLMMGTADGHPRIDYLPRSLRVTEPGSDQPPVWLVLGKTRRDGQDDQFLMPGDLETGQPDTRQWACGGNYADGDSRFTETVGHNHAVRIHDYDLFPKRG